MCFVVLAVFLCSHKSGEEGVLYSVKHGTISFDSKLRINVLNDIYYMRY